MTHMAPWKEGAEDGEKAQADALQPQPWPG